MKKIFGTLICVLTLFVTAGCTTKNASVKDKDTLYQVALLQALMLGNYDGSVSIGELKKHGDTGIGTFDRANGELIMLDGVVYAAVADGSVNVVEDSMTVPFCNITYFEEDYKVDLENVASLKNLMDQLTEKVNGYGPNYFYMVKINGKFNHMQYRSEYPQEKPYINFAKSMEKVQVVFEGDDIEGTIVGLYCPAFITGINSEGWHFHFVSNVRKIGGHILNLNFEKAEAVLDKTPGFNMELPAGDVYTNLDFRTDLESDIRKVELNVD